MTSAPLVARLMYDYDLNILKIEAIDQVVSTSGSDNGTPGFIGRFMSYVFFNIEYGEKELNKEKKN